MKIRIWIVLFLIGLLALFLGYNTIDYIHYLEDSLEEKDKKINLLTQNDSILESKTKQYSETITKYVRDCNVIINDKQVSLVDFIDLYLKEREEKLQLKDSITKLDYMYQKMTERFGQSFDLKNSNDSVTYISSVYNKTDTALAFYKVYKDRIKNLSGIKDSLEIYKVLFGSMKNRYGIDITYQYNSNKLSLEYLGTEKLDSALALFPYYRHRIEVEDGKWIIQVDNEYISKERKAKREKRRMKRDSLRKN